MASTTSFGLDSTATEVAAAFPASVRGKTIVITGVSSDGIGGATAEALASQSPSWLILSGRSSSKVDPVISSLHAKYPSINYKFLQMDLSSFLSVRTAASELNHSTDIPSIDILINNAGVMAIQTRTLSEDGQEMQFATNHLGHFLFTNLILPKLITAASSSKTSASPVRIINLTSFGHVFSPIRVSDPQFTLPPSSLPASEQPNISLIQQLFDLPISDSEPYNCYFAYGQSKTANILYSCRLTELLHAKYGITSFAVHPGSIATGLQRHVPAEVLDKARQKMIDSGMIPKRKSRDQGAATSLRAALDPDLQVPQLVRVGERDDDDDGDGGKIWGKTKGLWKGVYLVDCQVADDQCAEHARDGEAAERLWEMSEEIVGKKFGW